MPDVWEEVEGGAEVVGELSAPVGGEDVVGVAEDDVDQIAHPDPAVAADFVYRTLFALATQTVMFDDSEVSSREYDATRRAQETGRLLLAYLQSPGNVPGG